MNKEHKLTYNEKSHCCHDNLIESNFGTLDGFKEHFATEWGCTVEDLSYEEIDLTEITLKPLISKEWETANKIALNICDLNSRAQCQYLMVTQPDNVPLQTAIQEIWDAMENIWNQYATNKALIEAGQDPNEYVIPEGVPTIWDIMALKNA